MTEVWVLMFYFCFSDDCAWLTMPTTYSSFKGCNKASLTASVARIEDGGWRGELKTATGPKDGLWGQICRPLLVESQFEKIRAAVTEAIEELQK